MMTLIASILALLDASAALRCELAPDARPTGLAAYHAMAETCLLFPPDGTSFDAAVEAELVARINAERRAADLPPLAIRPALLGAARFHSLDMAWTGTLSHQGAAGRSPFDRIAAMDRTLVASGARENVSRIGGDIAPDAVVDWIHDSLMGSDGHRANILAADATHVAIGVARRGDKIFTTQLFVTQLASLPAPLPVALVDPAALAPVTVRGWDFDHYAVDYTGAGPVPLTTAAPLPPGEGRLMVNARKPDADDPLRYYTIALPGPAVVVP